MNNFFYIIPFILQNLFFVFFLPIYKFFIRLEVRGRENLKNLKGPVILAPNHTSELDPTIIPLIFPVFSRLLPIYSVIYPIEKYSDPSFGWRRYIYKELFFEVLGGYPTFSGFKDYETSLENHINLLNKGRTVCIFPEGKCTTDGNLRPARGGLGFLVHETEATVIPLVINSLYGISFFDFLLRRRKVVMTILKPMTIDDIIFVEEPTVEDFRHGSQIVLDKIRESLKSQPLITYIDNDKELNLEKNSLFKSIFNIFFIPFLNSLPKNFKFLIRRTNEAAATVIDNATNHKALEVLYSKGDMFSLKKVGSQFFKYVWFNMNNSKAVRNRLKFVKRELKNHLENISDIDRDIEIISIASGSSRAIIETVKDGHYLKDAKLSITFLDKDENAIKYSKDLSVHINHLPIKLDWVHDSVGNFLRGLPAKKYDVVEIVGLLDYFNDDKVIETFKGIYSILEEGGIIITANVNHNKEEKFVSDIIDWKMIYRKVDELANLLVKAGFDSSKMRVFYEPLKIHGMIVAKK
ncbi:MAG: phospholipid/glycerol acyltransferase [Parcubacteria group bacterium Gr01-1014_46]|nr:MAG: phospholipid/glycerol acyltransferase [Parcubacteria group bacterium Gr01-1014_46]